MEDVSLQRALRANAVELMSIKSMLESRDLTHLSSEVASSAGGTVSLSIRENNKAQPKTFELVHGTHFFLSALHRYQSTQ